ncbi:MAG: hypothetical protein M1814_004795 [Vezdaea aestivalis]|nr:MAG: hypothetical protein M1814_004795 [Vezdaea aestivalis]
MAAADGPGPSPQGMYVKALYDYDADDATSLSFRQGDIIQVINTLESGWWDGLIANEDGRLRGWFPSNYCSVINDASNTSNADEADADADDEDLEAYDTDELESDTNSRDASPGLPLEGVDNREQEEAAYWIPQATPDGRLFYFNTLTGQSTMELPLETPTTATETGPRDRTNLNVPEYTRPPPELMAGGIEREDPDFDEGNSASEREGEELILASQDLSTRNVKTDQASGYSPSASFGSLKDVSPNIQAREQITGEKPIPAAHSLPASNSAANSSAKSKRLSHLPRSFFNDGSSAPLTWDRLADSMRRAVERYTLAITRRQKSLIVRRAEDISDFLRLLLAAGSGTTDNHSGNPSIISTNRALYPHFREVMSKFSKLVLSSHIAATDWPVPDAYSKCIREADGVLAGVYGFIEVARQQRGEEIPRLLPGFTIGSHTGGNWQNNGLVSSTSAIPIDQEDAPPAPPTARLSPDLIGHLEDIKRIIISSIRQLDDKLIMHDKVVSSQRHDSISSYICKAASKVLEDFRPWFSTVESINLSPLGVKNPHSSMSLYNPQLVDFSGQKQRLYDLISDLMITCQAVAGPLGDEWSEIKGEPLEDRLKDVRIVAKQLETCTSQLMLSLSQLLELMPREDEILREEINRRAEGVASRDHYRQSTKAGPNTVHQDHGKTWVDGVDLSLEHFRKGENSKAAKFFGEVPGKPREPDETPPYLKLDHENELAYDDKVSPPILRGGTLAALVEQLTRHDSRDAGFNNTFLLTYRSFTTASELFEILVERFTIQPPSGLNNSELQVWVKNKQTIIRFRVVNILKSWVDNYWMEGQDEASKSLLRRIHAFAKDSVATSNQSGAQPLMTVLEQRIQGQETGTKKMVPTNPSIYPQPILPRNMRKMKFLDIDVTEFARQLTIIESKLYGKIKPSECLNKTWQSNSESGENTAVNIKALIVHSNSLTNWVAQLVLQQPGVKQRVAVIKHFVAVADKCRGLNNFSTLTSIISAFSTAPIHRLKRTWEQTPQRTAVLLEQMRRLMGSTKNFGEYRETLRNSNPPAVPFLGVFLTDMRMMTDGIPSMIKQTNLINFTKRTKTAEVIREIQQHQHVPYALQSVPELQEYIVKNVQAATDVHEMYEKSLTVEPREREDERVAR